MYVQQGFVELLYFPLSGDQPNEKHAQKLYFMKNFESHVRHENIAHHDCFYRNMYDFKFISPIGELASEQRGRTSMSRWPIITCLVSLDIDEVIAPQIDMNLPQMIKGILEAKVENDDISDFSSLSFDHAYFFTGFFPRILDQSEMVPR